MTPDFELSGYTELFADYQVGVTGKPYNLTERIRPTLELRPQDRLTLNVTVEAGLHQGRNTTDEAVDLVLDSELGQLLTEAGCSYTPEEEYTVASDYLSVERFYLGLNLPAVDLKIGRQNLAWGSSTFLHPSDPFQEVVALTPWKERSGSNAIRAEVPIDDDSLTAFVAVEDDISWFYTEDADFENLPMVGAARYTLRALGTDWAAVAWGRPDGDWYAGADLKGTLGVGWWVEGGWRGDREAAEVVVGLDYSVPVGQSLYIGAEYRYDGSGASDPDQYNWDARTSQYTGGSGGLPIDCAFLPQQAAVAPRLTLGQHYAHGFVRFLPTTDLSFQAVTVMNLQDQTGTLMLNAGYIAGSHWSFTAAGLMPYGAEGEFAPPTEILTIEVETPDQTYTTDLNGLLYDADLIGYVRYNF